MEDYIVIKYIKKLMKIITEKEIIKDVSSRCNLLSIL